MGPCRCHRDVQGGIGYRDSAAGVSHEGDGTQPAYCTSITDAGAGQVRLDAALEGKE